MPVAGANEPLAVPAERLSDAAINGLEGLGDFHVGVRLLFAGSGRCDATLRSCKQWGQANALFTGEGKATSSDPVAAVGARSARDKRDTTERCHEERAAGQRAAGMAVIADAPESGIDRRAVPVVREQGVQLRFVPVTVY